MSKSKLAIFHPDHLQALKDKDPFLALAIDYLGPLDMEADNSLFEAFIHHIFKQQISTELAEKIWARFQESFDEITPENFKDLSVEDLSGFGISKRRMGWILEIAKFLFEHPDFEQKICGMEDDQLFRELMKLPGVGFWTVEMICIFYFQKANIFSFTDLGIHKGLRMIYGLEDKIDKDIFEEFRRHFAPYETLASIYIWKVAEGFVPCLGNPGKKTKNSR